ncbi:hypothetical protein ABKN59_006027 [Abortiporus biennis]
MSSANIPIMAQEGPDIFAMVNDISEVQRSPDSGSEGRLVDFEVSRIGDSGAVEDEGRSVDEQTDAPELEVLDTDEENRRAQEYLSTYLSSDSDRQLQPCTTSDSASHREDEDLLEISLLLQRPPSEWNFNKPEHIQDLAKVLQSVMKETDQASDEASGSPYTPALTTSSTPAVSPLVLPPSLSTGNYFPSSDISEEPRLQALDLSDGPTIALSDFVGAFGDEQLDNNNSLHIQGVVPMAPPGLVQQTLLPTNLNPVNQSVHYPYFDPRMGFASPQFHVLPPFYNGIYPHPSLYPFSPSQMIPVLGFMPASNFIHGSHSNPAFIQGSSRDHSLHPGAYVPPMTRSGQKRKAHFSDPSPSPSKRRCGASSSTGISNPPSSFPPPPVSPVVGSSSRQRTQAEPEGSKSAYGYTFSSSVRLSRR